MERPQDLGADGAFVIEAGGIEWPRRMSTPPTAVMSGQSAVRRPSRRTISSDQSGPSASCAEGSSILIREIP